MRFAGSVTNSLADDWALLSLARKASSQEAGVLISELVGRLRPKAYALAFRLLQDAALAEDIVQESFLRLWRGSAVDNGQARLSTYFHQIVVHESMRALSRRPQEVLVATESLIEIADQQQAEQADLADYAHEFSGALDSTVLEQALARLPDRQRAALVLWAFADASIAEIASQLKIAENAAHQLLHRAKQSLKKNWKVIA